jgi:queuine tRNA-ribosyltransferase
MFDCVLPTRIGRHGKAFTSHGDINLKNAEHKLSDKAIDDHCDCKICKNYSRLYIRHLMNENEMQGMSMISYHNLRFLIKLSEDARVAIIDGKYDEFREKFYKKLNT